MTKVGILGFGTVGSAFYQLIQQVSEIEVSKVAVRDLNKSREGLSRSMLTDKPEDIVNDAEINIIVEVMGGVEPAFEYVKTALGSGKHVVTANKALLAEKGETLFELAEKNNVGLFYEAAVAGSIPIINTLQTHLESDEVHTIEGILNGTSNYILTEMNNRQIDFAEALQDATDKGYAEADPSHDIKLIDAAHKLVLLIRLAFGKQINLEELSCKGIKHIRYLDMSYAEQFDCVIKPVARASYKKNSDELVAYVEPMLVHQRHMLCGCEGVMNAVTLETAHCDELSFVGPGAGAYPTATSVHADFMHALRGEHYRATAEKTQLTKVEDNSERSEFYIRLIVRHEVGILAKLTQLFTDCDINIKAIHQKQQESGLEADEKLIVILTEGLLDSQIESLTIKLKDDLNFAKQDKLILRIMGAHK